MTTLLTIPDHVGDLALEIPKLCAANWMEFKPAMEMLFLDAGAGYLIDATPSTPIPPQCSLLDHTLLCLLYFRMEKDFQHLVLDNRTSTLLVWTTLLSHFQKSTPQPVEPIPSTLPTLPVMDSIPSPDDSYAKVRTSTPDLASIIPSSLVASSTPSSMQSSYQFNSSTSAGTVHAFKKHFTLSTLHGFKKHFAAFPPRLEDFQYEICLCSSKWLEQVPGPGPPSFLPLSRFSGSIPSFLLFFSLQVFFLQQSLHPVGVLEIGF